MGFLKKLFGGGRRRREQPPRLAFLILGHGALPSPIALFDPSGADGKLRGVLGPAPGSEGAFAIDQPIANGTYLVLAGDAAFELELDADADAFRDNGGFDEVIADAGDEAVARTARATWTAALSLVHTEEGPMWKDPIAAMVTALDVADRIATLGDGITLDSAAYRVLVPGTWRVDDPVDLPFDPREHFNLHAVDEGTHLWIHSHGLVKLGKPEIELHTTIGDPSLQLLMFDILAGAALADLDIGHTTGDPNVPLHIVDALRRSAGDETHWEDTVVLALVDDKGKKGLADRGLRALMQ